MTTATKKLFRVKKELKLPRLNANETVTRRL